MRAPIETFESQGTETPHTEAHLTDYWAVVVKYRRVIVVCLVLTLIGAGALTILTQPMFRSTVVLDIVRQSNNPLGGSTPGGYEGDSAEFLPSQIELLKSRDVAERVVRRLNLLADPVFNPEGAAAFALPKGGGAPLQPTARQIEGAANRVKSNTSALVVRGTSLVQIEYVAPSGRQAAQVANAVADAYIDWNIEARFRAIGQSAQFLATQIAQAKRDIDTKETALRAYARQKDIVTVDPRSSTKLESLNRDYAVAVADRVSKESRFQELQGTSAESIAASGSLGLYAQLKGEQDRLEREYAEKLNLYKPEWPAMQQLKRQVDDGRKRLAAAVDETAAKAREAARTDYMFALRRENSLQAAIRSQQTEASSQSSNTSEYSNLQDEIDSKRALLDTLLKQQGETEILSRLREQQIANVRIVDRALVPGLPFKPSLSRNLIFGTIFGLGLGVGLAFLLSALDRSLRSADQVERYLQLPALGGIPKVVGERVRSAEEGPLKEGESPLEIELAPHREPRSAIAEAYRAFRTALLHSRAGGVRLVTITSVLPQEGKSTTAVNLAVILAQLGRRVLLVDADLHRSRLHSVMNVSNRQGLVSILAEGTEPSRVIVKTSVPGVFLVPAGPETPNPSGLLASDDMRRFLELAASNFDHVILDAPPVLATSDALVFGQYTDGVVLCIRAGRTPRDQARRVRDKLLRGGVQILGVLLTGVDLDLDYYGSYEYRYLNYGERAAAAIATAAEVDREKQAGEAS